MKPIVKPPPGFSSFQRHDGNQQTKTQTDKFRIGNGFQLTSGSSLSELNSSNTIPGDCHTKERPVKSIHS